MLKVLLALDGRANSKRTLDFASHLLRGRDVDVTLFHVIPQHIIYGRAAVAAEVYDMSAERARSTELLRACATYLQTQGIGPIIEGDIAVGDPADLILAVAAAYKSDMVIVGSHPINMISRFISGSTATRVSNHANCPVLVVHPKSANSVRQATARDDAARLA